MANLGVSGIGIGGYGRCEFFQVYAQCWVVVYFCSTNNENDYLR